MKSDSSAWFPFSRLEEAPADPILDIKRKYIADPRTGKVDLSVGVYQDDEGRTPLLHTVREVLHAQLPEFEHAGYLPIEGYEPFLAAVKKLIFGSDVVSSMGAEIAGVQSLGGTGALRLGAELLRVLSPGATVYLTDPTWPNHPSIFKSCGFTVAQLPYYSPETRTFEFSRCMESLNTIAAGSVVVLHASCHNPTGCDPTREQWAEMIDTLLRRRAVPFIDFAYQGLKEGIDEDAEPVRLCLSAGLPLLVSHSCSKNFSLYRRRVGTLFVAAGSPERGHIVQTQLRSIIRAVCSDSPIEGAAVVAAILGDEERQSRWRTEVDDMRVRLHKMRALLQDRLTQHGLAERFSHLSSQVGMFSFLGLSPSQMEVLEREYGIYAIRNSRICIAALNASNVDYVADSIARVAGPS